MLGIVARTSDRVENCFVCWWEPAPQHEADVVPCHGCDVRAASGITRSMDAPYPLSKRSFPRKKAWRRLPRAGGELLRVYFRNKNQGWAVGERGTIRK